MFAELLRCTFMSMVTSQLCNKGMVCICLLKYFQTFSKRCGFVGDSLCSQWTQCKTNLSTSVHLDMSDAGVFSFIILLVMLASQRIAAVDVDLSSSTTAYSSETESFAYPFRVANDVTHCLSSCFGSSSLVRDVQVSSLDMLLWLLLTSFTYG